MSHGQTKAGWRSVVEDINCIAVEAECLGEGVRGARQCVEGIRVFSFLRDFCESKTRQVWCDHAKLVCQAWDEFAEHKGRGRESMQQEHHRRARVACRTVEDFDSVCFDLMNGCHRYGQLGKNGTHETSPRFVEKK